MPDCIEAMAEALAALARGDAVLPLRSMVWLPDRTGLLGLMPAYLGSPRCLGIKVVTVMPGNHGTELDAHQGAVLLFEVERGRLLAVLDATSITAIRTAAVSGLATRLLARDDASDLAILGSGVQARSHLEAMCAVRPIRRARVWSRSADRAREFARRESRRRGVPVEAAPSARAAVEGAEIICTTTAAREPILHGAWIAEGAHVNAVGACLPDARELDTDAVVRSRLYVDRRESAEREAGDYLIPKREGALGEDHIRGEIGEILIGRAEGRRAAGDVTLFKSLGLAVEDLSAAHRIYQNAVARGDGRWLELGGVHDPDA
jgi:ornithine cyclodeaminase/alanine dehydrogenase-like protein (mu-crystallin family)